MYINVIIVYQRYYHIYINVIIVYQRYYCIYQCNYRVSVLLLYIST